MQWSKADAHWSKRADVDFNGESIQGLAIVAGEPIVVLKTRLLMPLRAKSFDVAENHGQITGRALRVSAIDVAGAKLWIGTSHGEWGGQLFSFDPTTAAWTQHVDDLQNVTGITHRDDNELIVSWSMSHFMASALVRVHSATSGTPTREMTTIDGNYFQRIVYCPYDKRIYCLDDDALITVNVDGKGQPTTQPTSVKISTDMYVREPMAMGVAPGIVALIPIAPETLVLVPTSGAPLIVHGRDIDALPGD